MRYLLVVGPHLARLFRLGRGWARPHSRRLSERRAVVVFFRKIIILILSVYSQYRNASVWVKMYTIMIPSKFGGSTVALILGEFQVDVSTPGKHFLVRVCICVFTAFFFWHHVFLCGFRTE